MAKHKKWIPLAHAAHRAGRSWPQMYRLVLSRRVRAEQHDGRWYVHPEDVEALEREADEPAGSAPT